MICQANIYLLISTWDAKNGFSVSDSSFEGILDMDDKASPKAYWDLLVEKSIVDLAWSDSFQIESNALDYKSGQMGELDLYFMDESGTNLVQITMRPNKQSPLIRNLIRPERK